MQCVKTAYCRPTILPIHKYPNPTPILPPRHPQSGGGDCACVGAVDFIQTTRNHVALAAGESGSDDSRVFGD